MDFTDHEELASRLKRRKRRQRSDIFWNFLTVCTILATVALTSVLLIIFSNPFISINPFPPPTMPVLAIYPTATPTLVAMPATWTPTPLLTATPRSETATLTPEPGDTATLQTPSTQVTADLSYQFVLQGSGSTEAFSSTLYKPETGCTWQGVAGQVVDMQGQPKLQIAIKLSGIYDGQTKELQTISGTHTEYGESGYEFQLGTIPINSTGLLSIQLVDQAGLPLSDRVIFDTYSTCDKNLVLINFKQIR